MSVSRLPQGLATATKNAPWGQYVQPDPSKVHSFFNDFDAYTGAAFTITTTGTGTQALTDGDGGLLLTSTSAGATDAVFTNKVGESFLPAPGKSMWYDTLVTLSDATTSSFVSGLQITDTTPLAVSDGIFFLKSTGSATVNLILSKASSNVTIPVGTMTTAQTRLSWYWDGSKITAFLNGVATASSAALTTTNLPTTELTVSFGLQNGAAAIKTLTTDYIFAAKMR